MPSVSTFDPAPLRKKGGRGTRASKAQTEGGKPRPSAYAFDRIVVLCSVRDRSRTELEARLAREGYSQQERVEALDRAQGCGLVDDMRFADAFIRARVHAGKGPKVIRRDLAAHGIELDDVAGWPYDYGMDDESLKERALEFLESHPARGSNPYASACRKLESRGYPASVVSHAARAWLEQL